MTPSEKTAQWRRDNPERSKASRRAYYLKNRENIIAKAKAWEAENPERKRERNRLRRIEKEYGFTQEKIDELLKTQGNTCAICGGEFKSSVETHIDHCHVNGHVRAILCGTCNRGLGVLEKDGGIWLSRAMIYLARHTTAGVSSVGLWRSH